MEKGVLQKLTSLCVICAVAGFALMGVAALRDGQREWRDYQSTYQKELLKMIDRDKKPTLYDRVAGMKPEIKQVVIDQWKTVDRCTSCHLGIDDPLFAGARQPFKSHPYPELLKKHPVEKYGCTICHGGQGLATTYEGAAHKTIEHWADPMVSKGLMQSRCGICHKIPESIGADRLVAGRQLFKDLHCAGCHRIGKEGGDVGPDLTAFADKDPVNFSYHNLQGGRSKQAWTIEHLKDPKRVSPGTPMRSFSLSDEQIDSLSSYLLSLSQKELPTQYRPLPAVPAGSAAAAGNEPQAARDEDRAGLSPEEVVAEARR